MKKRFPVPEHKPQTCTLQEGTVKCIFIDREAAAEGEPCWLVYVAKHNMVYRMREGHTRNMGPLNVRFCGHKDSPLMPDGPAFWVETTASIQVLI